MINEIGYKKLNNIKDIQVSLKELGLYDSSIDGIWADKTASGLTTLLRNYEVRNDVGVLMLPEVSSNPGLWGNELYTHAIKSVQEGLKPLGLYDLKIDGIWGKGTATGLAKAIKSFRKHNKVPTYGICFSNNLNLEEGFTDKVIEYCDSRGLYEGAANGLMTCMYFESAGTFSPDIQNMGGSNYFGLIQFGKMAATDLGLDLETIKGMSQLEQLEKAVFPYFDMWMKRGKKITQLEDFYLTILYPAAVGKKADEGVFFKGTKEYNQNRGLDVNSDGTVTVGEISRRLYDDYYMGMHPVNRVKL